MYEYKLLPSGGYDIFRRDRLVIRQTISPNFPESPEYNPLSEFHSEQLAKFIILKLDNQISPFITPEEEILLHDTELSTLEMMEMILST